MTEREDSQPALLDALAPPPPARLPAGAAPELPVARVLLDSGVPHLDRTFDYVVPRDHDAAVVPGGRVKVRFSGREMLGFVVERCEAAETASRLSLIHKVVSAVPVLSPEVLQLARQVAERGAGVTSDVLRAAIPPRVARVEKEFAGLTAPDPVCDPETPRPRQAALALTGYGEQSWVAQILDTVRRCLEQDGDAVVVLPDARDVGQVAEALEHVWGAEQVARLTADVGPTPRYRAFLRLRHGQARIAVGTRSAVFAPVPRLRQLIVVDDDDPSHAEPRAPYHHVREVALLRTVLTGCGLLFLSTSRSLEVQRLVERGWLQDVAPSRESRREASPLMMATADSHHTERDPMARGARLPAAAYRTAQQALQHGPVLVQVARAGFVPAVLCERCRVRQQCPSCHGPLSLPPHHEQSRTLRCRWCGLHHRGHRCAECGHDRFRAGVRGADRTAHELGRAFPNTTVISSTGDHPVREVSAAPAVVVSTPGVEPVAAEGYAAALLLDGDAQLSREGLDVPRRVLARWFRAASLVRPHGADPARSGAVVVTAEAEELTAALVRWDPVTYARRELYRRLELGLPPAKRMLSLTAEPEEAEAFIRAANLPEGVSWIGPSPLEDGRHRYLLFFGYAQAAEVVEEMRRLRRTQSAQRGDRAVRIAVDDVSALQV
ncbi:primosomal protein N' [Nesterenkonia sp. CL21]|uniref:primosomal protein N' family DNA-binding protein n=1 Tax=Nesterenkonia sp. CL21 TaxID=3064894 RepID=UPI0028782B38|nr:primosomal protein N' [Nesterenkonia sp. CL21]MDS2171765.1 primosomal protein N' [Nesterenkonia sp. CL21]